jgi:hypothetical protein
VLPDITGKFDNTRSSKKDISSLPTENQKQYAAHTEASTMKRRLKPRLAFVPMGLGADSSTGKCRHGTDTRDAGPFRSSQQQHLPHELPRHWLAPNPVLRERGLSLISTGSMYNAHP